MKNYKISDYALNKYSAGIVYRFNGQTITVTLADYLADNPDKNEQDFQELKILSDTIYYEEDRAESRQNRKNISINDMDNIRVFEGISFSDEYIEAQEEDEKKRKHLFIAKCALAMLTDKQRHRYLQYHVNNMTLRKIAKIEGVVHSKIQKSLKGAEKKIKIFCRQFIEGSQNSTKSKFCERTKGDKDS